MTTGKVDLAPIAEASLRWTDWIFSRYDLSIQPDGIYDVSEQPYKLLFPNTDAGPNDILLAGFKELERRIKASV